MGVFMTLMGNGQEVMTNMFKVMQEAAMRERGRGEGEKKTKNGRLDRKKITR